MMMTTSVPDLPPALRRVLLHSACARKSYEAAATILDQSGYHVIAHAFAFTARQEAEHAAVLAGLLGHPPLPQALIPVLPRDAAALLRRAVCRETVCAENLYPAARREAEERGQQRLAEALGRMARTEITHSRRFAQYLQALEDGTLLQHESRTGWLCLPCGCLHYGCAAPERCDGCGRGPGNFIRSDFHPFAVGE